MEGIIDVSNRTWPMLLCLGNVLLPSSPLPLMMQAQRRGYMNMKREGDQQKPKGEPAE